MDSVRTKDLEVCQLDCFRGPSSHHEYLPQNFRNNIAQNAERIIFEVFPVKVPFESRSASIYVDRLTLSS